jgi:hypothetical protein
VSTTLTTSIKLDVTTTIVNPLALQTVSAPGEMHASYVWGNGTAAGAADKMWSDHRTLAASTSESLDLAGSLVDAFGATITFARIRGIIVKAASANTNNVLVGGAASNGFLNWVSDQTDVVVVRPGGLFVSIAPDTTAYAVTAATGDLLKVANSSSGTSVTYDIFLIGASA